MTQIPVADNYDEYDMLFNHYHQIENKLKQKKRRRTKKKKRHTKKKDMEIMEKDMQDFDEVRIVVDGAVLSKYGSENLISALADVTLSKTFISIVFIITPGSINKAKAEKICWKMRNKNLFWNIEHELNIPKQTTKNNVLITGNDVLALEWMKANGKSLLCCKDKNSVNFLTMDLEKDDLQTKLKQYIHLN